MKDIERNLNVGVFFFFFKRCDCKGKKLAQLIWVKQKVWSFDLVSKVFLLSFLGFGFTFHRFLGNQTDIENSREKDLLGGDVSGMRLEEEVEVEVGRVGLENHAIIFVHCLHRFYLCRNFLFFDDAACHCSLSRGVKWVGLGGFGVGIIGLGI